MEKKIDTSSAMSKFFTPGTQDTQPSQENHDNYNNQNNYHNQENQNNQSTQERRGPGRPKKTDEEKVRGFRYSLLLDKDLNAFLHFMAWKNKTSMTQYLNNIIRGLKEEHLKNGGSPEDWSDWE